MVDGEVYFKQEVEFGDSLMLIDEPSGKEGYTFSGWSEVPEIMPRNDILVTGTFNINSYRVIYIVDGKEYKIVSCKYGATIKTEAAPTKKGHTFSGWSEHPATMPAEDVTVTGTFTVNTYEVTYTIDGEVYATDSVTYGTAIVVPEVSDREGYTFSWSKIPNVMPARDVLVTGSYTVNTYKVTFMIDNYVYRTDSIAYGAPITPPDPPVSPGYEFSGWSEYPATMPAQDLVITGVFWGTGLASIYTDEQGVVYNLNEEKDAYVVASVTNTLTDDVVIPGELNEVPVTAINDKAFIVVGNLRSVVIPASVTTVGDKAFYGCNNLLVVEWNTTAPVRAECFDKVDDHGNMLVFVSDASTEVSYKGNVIVDGVAEQITLTGSMPLRSPREFTARSITCTREFTKKTSIGVSGGWEAMVLPFDVQTVTSAKGELKPFDEADFITSLPCWIATMQADGTFADADGIKANVPFIMEVPNSDEYEDEYNIEGEVSFSATDVTVHATTGSQLPIADDYTFLGTYEGTVSGSGVYALNDEEYVADGTVYLPGGVFVRGSRDIRPFEAYVYSEGGSRAPYLRIGGKKGTGIGSQLMMDNGQLTVYDLMGRRISVGHLHELPKGVYIVNGRKTIIR